MIRWPGRRGAPERGRRVSVRREDLSAAERVRMALSSPRTGYAALIGLGAVLVITIVGGWASTQPLLALGRLSGETVVARSTFRVADPARTAEARQLASERAPRVFVPTNELQSLLDGLEQLPATLRDAEGIGQVAQEIRDRFGLSADELLAVQALTTEEGTSPAWTQAIGRLAEAIRRRPFVEAEVWQTERQRSAQLGGSEEGEAATVMLIRPGGASAEDEPRPVRTTAGSLINLGSDEQRSAAAESLANQAGLSDIALRSLVQGRLARQADPTYRLDEERTAEQQAAAVDMVADRFVEVQQGQVIVERGEAVGLETIKLVRAERAAGGAERGAGSLLIDSAGIAGVAALLAMGLSIYVARFVPRIAQRPERMVGLAGLYVACFSIAVWGAVIEPRLMSFTAVAPVLLLGMLLTIAYDTRVALTIGSSLAVLLLMVLDRPAWFLAMPLAGLMAVAWQLSDIRDRRALVRTGVVTGAVLAVACVCGGLLGRPLSPRGLLELAWDTGFAASGGLVTAGLVLFMLPTIERAFDITTGMKLIELRDPKQPLLRELQRRAPGTYNHAMNVASIAEAAADAIGADALQTYVGALYHDVGKMNKPEYFVENQSGGPNKHDKLSPAMSLLVIVGHVKDGMEMARRFNLPRSLHHYIEAHHGTTLVEYFYHRAKKRAAEEAQSEADRAASAGTEAEAVSEPEEIEYRYPGPKPRTKECAILMLADAVESATRTMADPTPSRIEALVRQLAQARLADGQFDDCDLTLRELDAVGDSIAKSVASIYHGRIVYPGGGEKAG
ncbi:MAG: HDIG domain-containing metalloprotein [Planctomycetota bacterium]